ncbi:PAS domain S-box-containing protein [Streptomyces zhaozhouensis]|uniref:protein-serine/threonine phosphatase n=1 Tax=Streptomyces zhaozhouensis TaxID=1300267 RepID=A0A286DQV1_9ACTN|nr:SpoIIE family protein phosphatase [Streptomyces zhaozhouensis]SOD61062.1 PAS domain S-box-containing protein [Streptomyces zhaozhouensis]
MHREPAHPDNPSGAQRSLLDILRFGFLMLDEADRVVLWSPTLDEILGRSQQRTLGTRLAELLVTEDDGTPPLTHRRVLADGGWRGMLRMRHADGSGVLMECRAYPLGEDDEGPLILANLLEVGEMLDVEQDLAALEGLFTASPLGIAIFDTELRYVRANDALRRLQDVGDRELRGRTVLDVLPDPTAQELYRVQREVLVTGQPVTNLVLSSPDGQGAQSLSLGQLLGRDGKPLGVSCTVMDISDRREALDKIERARQRLALLNDVGNAMSDLLDVRRIAEALAKQLVPRFGDYSSVQLLAPLATGGDPVPVGVLGEAELVQLSVAAKRHTEAIDRLLGVGRSESFPPTPLLAGALARGESDLTESQEALVEGLPEDSPMVESVVGLGIHSMLTLPLRARGTTLGVLLISRAGKRTSFDRDDLALATEVAARAAVSLDNARLYAREREGALMLQRSLLPQWLPELPGVSVSHRYVPSASGAEIGGDWFDVIPLAGGRIAFVIGDVTGHGLRAAATMGQLRTAVRTLATLDLAPSELLRRINDLGEDIAQHPDDPMMATCAYAVYDPASRICTIAKAGHLPPVLVGREDGDAWRARPLDLPAGMPLGVSGTSFEERRIELPEDTLLVLYTDGLIETRDEDLGVGLDRLCALLERVTGSDVPLGLVCDHLIGALRPHNQDHDSDDVALLIARLGGLPADRLATWTFPAERSMVREARGAVVATLREWGLDNLAEQAELLVSEVVTNAVRHARGPVEVRVVRGSSLLVEVTDPVADPPRERTATPEDEGGRGLSLVSRESRRWGTRRGPAGKTVWFELTTGP